MGLESATYVNDFTASNPPTSDNVSQGDDHIRLLKTVLQTTFPFAAKPFRFPTGAAYTSNQTVAATDDNELYYVDSSGGAVTLTLPTLTSGQAGWHIRVTKSDTGVTNPINITPPSGTINGQASIKLMKQWESVRVEWTGTVFTVQATAPPSPYRVISKTADDTLSDDEMRSLVLVDAASDPVTITLPAAAIGDWVMIRRVHATNDVVVEGDSAETIDGATSYEFTAQNETVLFVADAAGTWVKAWRSGENDQTTRGFTLLNGQLVASVSGNALTVALKTLAGNDPSSTDPVRIVFRGQSLTDEEYNVRSITAAMSIVASNGSSFGVSANTPFNLWVTFHDNAGTVSMGLSNRITSSGVSAFNEAKLTTTSAEGGAGGADTAGTIYTTSAIGSAKPFRIAGYLEFTSGLATAGVYNVGPDVVATLSPGMYLPGQVIRQHEVSSVAITATTSSTTFTNLAELAITPSLQSAGNYLRFDVHVSWGSDHGSGIFYGRVKVGGTVVGGGSDSSNRVGVLLYGITRGTDKLHMENGHFSYKPLSASPAVTFEWKTNISSLVLNRSADNTDVATTALGYSRITITEIQG